MQVCTSCTSCDLKKINKSILVEIIKKGMQQGQTLSELSFGCVDIIEALDPTPDFGAKSQKFCIFKFTKGQSKFFFFFTSEKDEEFGYLTSCPMRFFGLFYPLTSGLGPQGIAPRTELFYDASSDSVLVASFHKSPEYFKFNPRLDFNFFFFSASKGERKGWGNCNFIWLYFKRGLCTFVNSFEAIF